MRCFQGGPERGAGRKWQLRGASTWFRIDFRVHRVPRCVTFTSNPVNVWFSSATLFVGARLSVRRYPSSIIRIGSACVFRCTRAEGRVKRDSCTIRSEWYVIPTFRSYSLSLSLFLSLPSSDGRRNKHAVPPRRESNHAETLLGIFIRRVRIERERMCICTTARARSNYKRFEAAPWATRATPLLRARHACVTLPDRFQRRRAPPASLCVCTTARLRGAERRGEERWSRKRGLHTGLG